MPRFREFTDDQQSAPPFSFPGVSIHCFLLDAAIEKLQLYCDEILNIDPRYHFSPLAPLVYLGISEYPRMYCDYPPFAQVGYTRQNEFYFMFPTIRHDAVNHNILLGSEITWAFPFIGVDSSSSAFTGQEVLGFQKLLGTITAATAPDDGSFAADVAMPGFRAAGRDVPEEVLPILRIRSGPPLDGPAAPLHGWPWSLRSVGSMVEMLDDIGLHLMQAALPGLLSVTNLKQIRDAQDPTLANYQALVRCEWKTSNFSVPVVYDGADIDTLDNMTMPMTSALGLGPGPRFKASMAFSVTTDMTFDNITDLVVVT